MYIQIKRILLISFTLLTVGCSYTSVRQHTDFAESAKGIESVVVAPPKVTVEYLVFTGDNERLVDEEKRLQARLGEIAADKLAAEGLKVIDFDFKTAIQEDEEFAYALTQCREAYNQAAKDLYDGKAVSEQDKATFKSSIGDIVNTVADATGAESLLLIEYNGFKKSDGLIAKDMAAGVMLALLTGSVAVSPSEGGALNVALIHADNGNVLWTNYKAAPQLDAEVANLLLAEFPDMVWETEVPVETLLEAKEPVTEAPEVSAELAEVGDAS